MVHRSRLSHTLLAAAAIVALLGWTPTTHAQDVEVDITFGSGAMPGAAITATASVVINDGSTVESYAWTQTGGVEATLAGADAETVDITLGSTAAFKEMLLHHIAEPPISEDDLPPNVELPEEFPGGQQNRFEVVGLNPFAIEESGAVTFMVEVTTTSGTYSAESAVHAHLPWKPAAGIMNVPVGAVVLLHGKDQSSYDWTLAAPGSSSATLMDEATQNPEFTPDVTGTYTVEVTDEEAGETVTMAIYAGTWRGVITGQDSDGRPIADAACTGCHSGTVAPDQFTPWAQTGHAEIFSDNLDTSTHYGEGCFSCHTVGFDPDVDNSGIDEASDYQAFIDAGLLNNPGDNWDTVLAQFPETAKMANIQCENCHGPQDSAAHTQGSPRQNLSSDICATCHGEPLRHARFQQWQLSAHANYELAIEESGSGSCSRCHTGNGFLTWLEILLDDDPDTDPTASIEVTWEAADAHPQTCVTCHDPHASGTASGSDPGEGTTVRISGDTPPLIAGFTATDVGKGAICMTCHNTRRGLRNDSNWETVGAGDPARAPHSGAQTDVLMGQNAYFVPVGQRSYHSMLEDSCVDCHMESTPPPDVLAYNSGGTNHTFYASEDICAQCHSLVTADDVMDPVEEGLEELAAAIEADYLALVGSLTAAGNTIDVNGEATITDAADVMDVVFGEYHGRQALNFILSGGMEVGFQRIPDIDVIGAGGDTADLSAHAPAYLMQAGWNYTLLHSDGSHGVHNPAWVMQILNATGAAIEEGSGGGGGGTGETGPGVACTSQYTYWVEIAAHAPGSNNSQWRTDVVAQNDSQSMANIEFILHTASGDQSMPATVDAMGQGVFEDIVGIMDLEDKGALEICSDVPLRVAARIYTAGELCEIEGTFGQFIDGLTNLFGLTEGGTAKLLGLRQMEGAYRTNISVTNTGMTPAEVMITLYATDGSEVDNYTLTVDPGTVYQDIEPFSDNAPNLGWGYAEVSVVSGSGILASASVIDSAFNDATSIPMKR